jgi:SAM-dependent methyltransferase
MGHWVGSSSEDFAMSAPAPADTYIMGRTAAEYQRLHDQAKMLEPFTRRVLRQAGVLQGMRCLDIGCGVGDTMRVIGDFVGAKGHVTGVDMDEDAQREAGCLLGREGRSGFSFVQGEFSKLDTIEGQPFDLVFARLVLIHNPDPLAMLEAMQQCTKPGGRVIVLDYDFGPMAVHPRLEAFERFAVMWHGAGAKIGRDMRIGLKLPSLFAAAGIGYPDGTDVEAAVLPLARWEPMIAAVIHSVAPVAIKLGLADEATVADILDGLKSAATEGGYTVMPPQMVAAWKALD